MNGGTRRVVFVGAGHAHLFALKRAADFARAGVEVVVIAPDDFWYSGLATGMLGGRYAPVQDCVDIAALLGSHGRFIRERVAAIDPAARSLRLGAGATISYDVLAVNVGSEVQPMAGSDERVIAIKPLRNLERLRASLEHEREAGRQPRIVIVGGGASGCEIAANLRTLLGADGGTITLLSRTARLATSFPPRAAASVARRLAGLRVEVRAGVAVARVEDRAAVAESGERWPFDFLVNATGLRPPALLAESGLPVSERGEMLVDEFLRSTGDPRIFGGGDCVRLQGHEVEKIGVYAVRESPVLFANLLAALTDRPLRAFRPQRHCLLILNLGGGIGLARWWRWHWFGCAAFWLKDRIDRAWLARYQRADPCG